MDSSPRTLRGCKRPLAFRRNVPSQDTGQRHGTRRRRDLDPEIERARLTERAKFARAVDVELQVACRTEAATRHELGIVARELLRRRAYGRLGFVRLADYARERVGVSARTLQAAAWVATRLEALPLVATAFNRSELSWARVRAVCAVARPDDQERWLAIARESTVEDLEKAAAEARRNDTSDADRIGVDSRGHDPDDDDGILDGEPAIRWRFACPARVRALWRRALELASRAAGEQLAAWRATEIVAAEALSGRPAGVPLLDRAILTCLRVVGRARRPAETGSAPRPPLLDASSSNPSALADHPSALAHDRVAHDGPSTDPFALDARLVAAIRAIRTSEPRIGRLLRIVADQRVYRTHGFTSLAAYVRERLGISVRKAWALLKVERSTRRGDDFAHAYDSGAISWICALTLLPVVDRGNASAWLERADAVTVRRLGDEVNWVLERRDLYGSSAPLDPPPLDSALTAPAASAASGELVHIGAQTPLEAAVTKFDGARRAALEVCDVEIQVTAPASIVALMRDALDAFSEPGAPRWLALERVLQHVIAHWEATPRHRDPIFARDGWRCAVPGCSSRGNLHDHHLQYRSRGGGNERANRITVCASHHLHGLHAGVVRAWGSAPRDVHWELGVRPTGPPLLAFVGDRRCPDIRRREAPEAAKTIA